MDSAKLFRRKLFRKAGVATLAATGAAMFGTSGPGSVPHASAAPASTPVRSGTLKVAHVGDVPTFDVHTTTAEVTATETQTVFESLFALDAGGSAQPLLATGAHWSDGNSTLTIPLRAGVSFHDGTVMTADDVVASLARWLKLAALGQQAAGAIKDIVSKGPQTVQIHLSKPFGLLPTYLANPNNMAAIMPRALIQRYGDQPIPIPVGTGPYKFQDWRPDAYVKLVRWDKYVPVNQPPSAYAGRRVAYLDEIDFLPVPDANTRLAGLMSGEYDFAFQISPDSYPQVTGTPSLTANIIKPTQWLIFSLNKAQRMFTNLKLRQAFVKALDPGFDSS